MTSFSDSLTRRDFLKLASLGLTTAFLPEGLTTAYASKGLFPDQEGRVAETSIQLFEAPSFDSLVVKEHWQDIILPITGITISDDVEAHNRVWYRIGGEDFVYSGGIQPVRTQLNKPTYEHPVAGHLAGSDCSLHRCAP